MLALHGHWVPAIHAGTTGMIKLIGGEIIHPEQDSNEESNPP